MKLRTRVLKATVYFDACLVADERVNGDTLGWMDVYGSLGRMANWVILGCKMNLHVLWPQNMLSTGHVSCHWGPRAAVRSYKNEAQIFFVLF